MCLVKVNKAAGTNFKFAKRNGQSLARELPPRFLEG